VDLEVSENNLYNWRALPLLYEVANITVEISCQALFILFRKDKGSERCNKHSGKR